MNKPFTLNDLKELEDYISLLTSGDCDPTTAAFEEDVPEYLISAWNGYYKARKVLVEAMKQSGVKL